MKQEQKIWIQGNPKRGKEVIAKLESLGGKNIGEHYGTGDCIYFICPDGSIWWAGYSDTLYDIIKDNYREYRLPDKYSLKPFDKIIIRTGGGVWRPSMYAFYNAGELHLVGGTYIDSSCCQVVPFNKDTEHLIGTKDEYTI